MTGAPDETPLPAVDTALAARLFDEMRIRTADPPGVTRAAFGSGEEVAHAMIRREAERLSLEVAVDSAGNLYVTLPGRAPDRPAWLVGSHLDSVPHGGNFDGAAGVIAGLCALVALREARVVPFRPITLVVFRAEESTWFPVSYLGSRAAFGLLPAAALDTRRSDSGRTLRDHMLDLGLQPDRVAAGAAHLRPEAIYGFVELHIEQGPVLDAARVPIGLVTAIAGSFRYREARCFGTTAHSGAVPRALRADAVFALAALIMRLDAAWRDLLAEGRNATVTVGQVATDPAQHAFSKIPGEVGFCLDVRSPDPDVLAIIEAELLRSAAAIEKDRGVRFAWGPRTSSEPVQLDAELRRRLTTVATDLDLSTMVMPSGAGHDTAVLASVGVPAAMIFIRNQNGSHNPHEAMQAEDFGAGVLLLTNLLFNEC